MKNPTPTGGQPVYVRRDAANRICLTIPAGIGSCRASAKFSLYMMRRQHLHGVVRRFLCWGKGDPGQRSSSIYRARGATP